MSSHSVATHRTWPGRSPEAGQWFICFNPQAGVRLRLFCFPYAGADANVFRDWARAMPEGVEVVGVQYPGRGGNLEARPIATCAEMVSRLRDLIEPFLGAAFAFFGHSNGALISFELARGLAPGRRAGLLHHFVSAKAAPHLPSRCKKLGRLGNQDFIRELRDMGGTPRDVLEDRHLMEMLLPRLRADFTLGEDYSFQPGELLACGMSLLWGDRDDLAEEAMVKRWSELTTGSVEGHLIRGDHFFLHSSKTDVLKIVCSKLRELLPGRKPARAPEVSP